MYIYIRQYIRICSHSQSFVHKHYGWSNNTSYWVLDTTVFCEALLIVFFTMPLSPRSLITLRFSGSQPDCSIVIHFLSSSTMHGISNPRGHNFTLNLSRIIHGFLLHSERLYMCIYVYTYHMMNHTWIWVPYDISIWWNKSLIIMMNKCMSLRSNQKMLSSESNICSQVGTWHTDRLWASHGVPTR